MANAAPNLIVVELFYDVRSPFAWFGFEALNRFNKKFSQMTLKLRPVSLVQIGRATGNSTPLNLPAKAAYMTKDLRRLAEYFEMPLQFPKDVRHVMFVKGTQAALCLLTVVAEKRPSFLESLSRSLFLRIWSKDKDVTSEESLKEASIEAGIPLNDVDFLIQASQAESVATALEATGKEALKYGAFGVPTYVAHLPDKPITFFGTDRLFLLCHYLNEPFPGPLNDLKSSKL